MTKRLIAIGRDQSMPSHWMEELGWMKILLYTKTIAEATLAGTIFQTRERHYDYQQRMSYLDRVKHQRESNIRKGVRGNLRVIK